MKWNFVPSRRGRSSMMDPGCQVINVDFSEFDLTGDQPGCRKLSMISRWLSASASGEAAERASHRKQRGSTDRAWFAPTKWRLVRVLGRANEAGRLRIAQQGECAKRHANDIFVVHRQEDGSGHSRLRGPSIRSFPDATCAQELRKSE
jgi:hypothetical protein